MSGVAFAALRAAFLVGVVNKANRETFHINVPVDGFLSRFTLGDFPADLHTLLIGCRMGVSTSCSEKIGEVSTCKQPTRTVPKAIPMACPGKQPGIAGNGGKFAGRGNFAGNLGSHGRTRKKHGKKQAA
jgi:hypothetical protein